MVGTRTKKELLESSMQNLSSFIAEAVQREESTNTSLIQNMVQPTTRTSSLPTSPLSTTSNNNQLASNSTIPSSSSSAHVSFNTPDTIENICKNQSSSNRFNNNNLIINTSMMAMMNNEYNNQPSTSTPTSLKVRTISPLHDSPPPSSSNFSNNNNMEMITASSRGSYSRRQSPYDPFAQQLSLSQYTLQSSKSVNTSVNNNNNNMNNNNNNSIRDENEHHHHHHHHHDPSKWERKLLEITRVAFVSMLGSKNKRLSEWTLMNQISESLTDITSSQFCIILKAVNPPSQQQESNYNTNSPTHSPSPTTNNPPDVSNDVHLQVIGIYGIETEAAKLFVAPYRHKVPTSGPHSIFAHCYNRQQIIINNLSSTTNLPPGHLPISNSICVPICYGKECIGVVLLSNRFSGYREDMEKSLVAWAQSLGQMLKMYAVLFENETGQSFFDTSNINMPPVTVNPYGSKFRREYGDSPISCMPGRLPHPFDFNANHIRRASISNIQISKPAAYLGKLGKSKSSGNVFTVNDRVSRNSSFSSVCNDNDSESGECKKSLRIDVSNDVDGMDQDERRVPNRNFSASPCSSVSSVSDSHGEEYQDPISLFEEIENEMLKSAELSLALFKAVQDSILILDQNLNITTMNPSAKKFFGVSTNQSPNTSIPYMGNGSQIISVRDLIPDNSTQHLNWSEVCKPNGVSWYRGKALAKCRNNNNFDNNRTASGLLMASHSPSTTVTNYVELLSNTPLSPNTSAGTISPTGVEDHSMNRKQDSSQDFSRLVPIAISVTSFFFKEEIYFSVTVTDESSKEDMKDKMKFIAFLSHELRNPIQVIVSGVQCLVDIFKDNEDSDDMDNGKSIIKSISSSSDFISHIINDMIDLTKLESGHMKVIESSFNIREKVEQIVEMLKIYQVDKNIDISYQIDDAVPQNLYSDATKLQQIILNIMSNSCKYTKSGSVRLVCSYENLTEDNKPKKNIIFKIQDTGVGIEKEEIPKIFRIYRRLHRKQHEVSGSGIGLALSKLLSRATVARSEETFPRNTNRGIIKR
ncbi:predicted protein [Naegleria gruberi]|uniref:histidine kinase n=1 Tax=Naegleria gruberi TaxID=5762 RepID=D2VHF8_NAEGR|nr:uncharacterized protein NAEGRDRAFT_49570 [Naegleria gruberi]EFC43579.1 predicted protein [Naegleria gruberi]|eukprot:XP_002676323.1 predicted protein [Naegleria gruberi strain NEG-M]